MRGELHRFDCRGKPLARESRADEEKQRVARLATQLGARRPAQLVTLSRMEIFEIDAVVYDVQFFRRNAKAAADLLAHHARVADHRSQPRMLEELAFSRTDVAMVRIQGDTQALDERRRERAQVEPAPMHAVARAIDVAPRNT